MLSTAVTVRNLLGLHARAANILAATASKFASTIELEDQSTGRRVDAKSIMQILMIAAGQGSELILHIDGSDQESAVVQLVSLFAEGFGEQCE